MNNDDNKKFEELSKEAQEELSNGNDPEFDNK